MRYDFAADMAAAREALGARAGETLPEAAERVRSTERERCADVVARLLRDADPADFEALAIEIPIALRRSGGP